MTGERHIARLWERMAAVYGHRWTSAYGDADDGTWLQGLADMTPEQIGHAIGRCATRDDAWPPSLPEFRRLCLPDPEELGLPDEQSAYRMACHLDWSHPAVYEAAQQVGTLELRSQPQARTWPAFRDAWRRVVERAQRGEQFPGPTPGAALAIETDRPPEGEPLPAEQARSRVQDLKAALRGGQQGEAA